MNQSKEIAIIGAGPCGLMAAERLAQQGFRIVVYDQMPSPARKLLIAGRGGLNLTHSEPLESFIPRYGGAAEWLAPTIKAFTPNDLRHWCEGLRQATFIGSSGRIFPRSMKAVQLLRAWLVRLEKLGVGYAPNHRWCGWDNAHHLFTDRQGEFVQVKADAALLALGGASWPRLGSDGTWTEILAAEGIDLAPLRPSNCGFIVPWSDYIRERFVGMPLKSVSITHGGITRCGEAMITAHGIEGGLIYAFSAALRDTIEADGNTTLQLDLRPQMSVEALVRKLQRRPRANQSLSTYLRAAGLSPLDVALLREAIPAQSLTQARAETLAAWLKALPVTLHAPTGMTRAISSAGGVRQTSVNADFMLKARPGVFVAGEMLDWEAPTGGYLLQACFSTGVAAAQGIRRYLAVES